MPLLKIQTNRAIDPEQRPAILRLASERTARLLGKPESYVMVVLEPNPDMLFAGDDAPLAYLELKSIGLPGERTRELASGLCDLVRETLDVPAERVYVEFADARRHMWGWKGGTF